MEILAFLVSKLVYALRRTWPTSILIRHLLVTVNGEVRMLVMCPWTDTSHILFYTEVSNVFKKSFASSTRDLRVFFPLLLGYSLHRILYYSAAKEFLQAQIFYFFSAELIKVCSEGNNAIFLHRRQFSC